MQKKVIKLFITQNDENKTRKSVSSIELDRLGIKEDKFYNKNIQRSVLLTSMDSYLMAKEQDITLEYGALGENILFDFNPYHLLEGDRISIGDSILEITQNCTLCKGLSSVNPKLPKLLKNDRGIFAKFISGSGTVSLNDTVKIQGDNA
jgi:MOSC domain-containing protein YiiM